MRASIFQVSPILSKYLLQLSSLLPSAATLLLGASFLDSFPTLQLFSQLKRGSPCYVLVGGTVSAAPTKGRSRRAERQSVLMFSKDHYIPELTDKKPNWRLSFYTTLSPFLETCWRKTYRRPRVFI